MQKKIRRINEAWEAHAQVKNSLSDDEEESRYSALSGDLERTLREDAEVLDALRDMVRGVSEPFDVSVGFVDFVRETLAPHAFFALQNQDAFRSQVEVQFTPDVMPIRPALTLPIAHQLVQFGATDDLLDYPWTWFAGRPVGSSDAQWPRRSDGKVLTHVLQVALHEEAMNVPDFEALELPGTGVLQVFHDLTSPGDPGDHAAGAWTLRWLEDDEGQVRGEVGLLSWPDDMPPERRLAAVPINADVTPTIPSALDVDSLSDEDFERYERVQDLLNWWPYVRNIQRASVDADGDDGLQGNPWSPDFVAVEPISRLGGFSDCETNPDHEQVLREVLPLSDGDRHVLLADLNPRQFTGEDWFHGGRHLQVWMRRNDLTCRRFDDAWCFIRTDC